MIICRIHAISPPDCPRMTMAVPRDFSWALLNLVTRITVLYLLTSGQSHPSQQRPILVQRVRIIDPRLLAATKSGRAYVSDLMPRPHQHLDQRRQLWYYPVISIMYLYPCWDGPVPHVGQNLYLSIGCPGQRKASYPAWPHRRVEDDGLPS
jgi:hypothetical protein